MESQYQLSQITFTVMLAWCKQSRREESKCLCSIFRQAIIFHAHLFLPTKVLYLPHPHWKKIVFGNRWTLKVVIRKQFYQPILSFWWREYQSLEVKSICLRWLLSWPCKDCSAWKSEKNELAVDPPSMAYGKSRNAKKLILDFSFLSYWQK